MLSPRIEDYLEELFLIESTGSDVTVTDLAERLKITKGTVTATVQKLVELKLVNHERYGNLHLTPEGRKQGAITFRRHEGFREFFHEVLGLDRDHSSDMACSMEHYVDQLTEDRLYALLEFFRKSEQENQSWVNEMFAAIKNPVLSVPVPLTLCENESEGVILRLTAEGNLRENLLKCGFKSGIKIKFHGLESENYICEKDGEFFNLKLNEAATIWIQKENL